jgi:hypothetical protein
VSISFETGEVDLSMVVLSNGKAFVHPTIKCFLCGNAGGLKNRCDHEGCKVKDGDKQVPVSFHVTCARQAGLEVQSEQVGRKTLHSGKSAGRGLQMFVFRSLSRSLTLLSSSLPPTL